MHLSRGPQPTIMIRYYTLFCKLFSSKIWTGKQAGECTECRMRESIVCPACGSRGNCAAHGSYSRSLIDFEGGKVVYRTVEIRRVRCASCGHTHAVLPDQVIPYSTYSLPFIIRVLAVYFRGSWTVEWICRHFSISPSMLYQWKALFLEHKEIWLGVLESAETAPLEFICRLLALPSYSAGFGKPFWLKTARSFLQRHRDAAYFRHAVFWS